MDSVKLVKELIKFKTISYSDYKPMEDSYSLIDFLSFKLENLGFKVRILEFRKGYPNLYAFKDFNAKHTISFITHYDVVPPGEIKRWKTSPFTPTEKKGRIYGRGASDDKAGIASFLEAMNYLKESRHNIKFFCFSDEEVGSKYGMLSLIKRNKTLLKSDFAFILDCSTKGITIGCSGTLSGEILIKGKEGHSGYPYKCKNALEDGLKISGYLLKFKEKEEKIESKKAKAPKGAPRKYVWNRFNITVFNSGIKSNIIPGECIIKFNWRFIPEQNVNMRAREFKELFKKWKKKLGINAKLKFSTLHQGYLVKEDNAFVNKLKGIANKDCFVELGANDGSFISNLIGIPAIGFGPIDEDSNYHGVNEFVRIKTLKRMSKLIRSFVQI